MNIQIPRSFIVGESIRWQYASADYRVSDGYKLAYNFKGVDGGFKVEGVVNGESYRFEITSADSTNLKAGRYWWQLVATQENIMIGSNLLHVIDSGEVEIKPNLSLLDSYDGRNHLEKVLDALEACLQGKASRDQMSYSIASRSLSRMNPDELLKWRNQYRAELITHKRKSGDLRDQSIKVRF